MENNINMLHS